MNEDKDAMTPIERRASIGLASMYGLRMLGLFIILPIFAIYAQQLPGGQSQTLVGIALGAYGLTQAILQIPAGWLSDRYGRKPVIYVGLILFAIGSFVAGSADNIYWIIAGRVIQGAGAINAAVMALTADLTREEHRTKAMAMIGITIGITFSISLVLSPLLYQVIGVPGIFKLIGVLALLAMAVVAFVIPNPLITRFHSDTEATTKKIGISRIGGASHMPISAGGNGAIVAYAAATQHLGRGAGTAGFLYLVQRAGGNVAFDDQQDRTAGSKGNSDGGI